jgi:hypothetical protein
MSFSCGNIAMRASETIHFCVRISGWLGDAGALPVFAESLLYGLPAQRVLPWL